jgi:8-oxo-dGTP pyrophosphatase MutT (NUDIX family)
MLNSLHELVDAIDSNNHVTGSLPRSESYAKKISHRIVHVMLVDGSKIYLVRRAMTVRYLPGFYCSSAGGHVLSGETSAQAAEREAFEEIGLEGPHQLIEEFFFEHEFKVHVSLYIKEFNRTRDLLNLNPSEVMSGEFLSVDEISNLDPLLMHPQLVPCLEKTIAYLKDSAL